MTSSWPYQFVSLSEEEKEHRRELLDLRGTYAQWSIIVAIVALRLYQTWATNQGDGDSATKPRRGPSSWWDRPIVTGWMETRRQYLVCGLWLLWLLSLSVWNSGNGMFEATFVALRAMRIIETMVDPNRRLSSPDESIGTCRIVAGPDASFDVACSVHLHEKAISIIDGLFLDFSSASDDNTIPPPLWPRRDLAFTIWTRHSLPTLLCAI